MIKRFKNLVFVGTSHIAKESVTSVEKTINKEKPQIIALELDRSRFFSLLPQKRKKVKLKDIRKIGIKGFLFGLIAAFIEHKLGKMVGTPPGSEMKKAIEVARKNKIDIALIDQDIKITLRNISKRLTWKEKFRFGGDLLKAIFLRKKVASFNLKKVPSEKLIKKLTGEIKKRYPSLYQSLIIDRDLYMSKALYKVSTDHYNKKVVAVVGAGHIDGILSNLKKEKWPKRKRRKSVKKKSR
tara:strand:- start:839 stop:1558 length:720 start_codon:yes stop_codon:yes gene_type:complete